MARKKNYKYVTDCFGNIAEVFFFGSEAKALKALKSLSRCSECWNCYKCENCFKCVECVGIKNSENLIRKFITSYTKPPAAYLKPKTAAWRKNKKAYETECEAEANERKQKIGCSRSYKD